MLEITTLGNLSIRRNESDLTKLLSHKAQALLLYLAYRRQPQSRGHLAELFWYERAEEQALSNLRTLLTRMRPHLEPYLVISRDSVTFNPAQNYFLDIRELQQELAAARQYYVRQGRLSGEMVARLEQALNLYRGEFLAGLHLAESGGFEEWVSQERESLHQQVIEALQQVVSYYQNLENYTAASETVVRLLELDPLREEAHRQRLLLLALSGQRSAALNHYKAYQRYLARELDIAPEAETTDLYERIRSGEIGPDKNEGVSLGGKGRIGTVLPSRVSQLKRVSLFANTPESVLVELADLLEEEAVKAGQTIFEKGEMGHCMYIIVEGTVRVHDDNRTLNDLTARDIFGEMAVLDSAPRLASVVALTDTRLWRLEQETLYKLMAGRLEVVRGIIQVLSSRLRERVQDVIELSAQLRSTQATPTER